MLNPTGAGTRITEVHEESLLGWIANRVAPSLFALREDDPDEVLRQLQFLPTDFLHRFSNRDMVFTSYSISSGEKLNNVEDASSEKINPMETYTAAPLPSLLRIHEVQPIRTVIQFGIGEREAIRQRHLFELSTFATLLRRPRQEYSQSIFWCSLIEKLEKFDFTDLMKCHISKIWSAIKEQQLTGFHALRMLSLSCDVLLLFSEHAWSTSPRVETLSDLVRLSSEMWTESTPIEIRRCAVVLSAFVVNFPLLLPIKELCDSAEVIDAPHLFVLLARVPELYGESKGNGDLLRQALGVAFATTVYAIPINTFFCADGAQPVLLTIVKQRLANVIYRLFENVSVDFWGYFTIHALLSVLEAVGMYSCFWDLFPSGMMKLWQHIQMVIKTRGENDTFAISLVNYFTAAAAYHCDLTELNNMVTTSTTTRATTCHDLRINKKGQGMADDENVTFLDGDSSNISSETSLVKKTMSLLSTSWSSLCVNQSAVTDKTFFHSSLFLFHALLVNYPHKQRELENFMGCSASLLLQQLATTLFTEHVYDIPLIRTLYGTIACFQDLLNNVEYLALLLLQPDELSDFAKFSDVALLQLQLYATLMASRSNDLWASHLIDVATHIPRGIILHIFTGATLFTQWLLIVESAYSCDVASLIALLSNHMTPEYLIHWLCEGMYVLLGEAQAGITFVCATPTVVLLEKTLRLLSNAVLLNRLTDSLATCVISIDGGHHSVSACFMLFSMVFATDAPTSLIEDAAELLSHVMMHSRVKLFNTMRLHTATTTKQELSATLLRVVARPKTSSINVIRLACLRRLLCYDSPSFFYLVDSDGSRKRCSGLQLVIILRGIVSSSQSTELEKAEALEILGALHDDDDDADSVKAVELLDSLDPNSPKFVRGALVAAVVRYVGITILSDMNAERRKTPLQQPQPQPQKSPNPIGSSQMRSRVLANHEKVVRKSVVASCEALRECYTYFNETEKDLCVSAFDDLGAYPTTQGETNKVFVDSSQASATACTPFNVSSQYRSLPTSMQIHDPRRKLAPLFLGDNFFIRSNDERCICVNRLASVMDATRRLTTALETLIWVAAEEREPFLPPLLLEVLESTLSGMHMVRPTISMLSGVMWECFEGWLLCARAAAILFGQYSTDEGSFLQTSIKLNALFQSFINIIVSNRGSVDVVCQGLGVLTVFQPSDTSDVASMAQIFHLIADVLKGRANNMPFSSLLTFITEVGVIYNHLGHLCPSTCAQSTIENLWSLALYVSRFISATEASSSAADLFDHILATLNTFLLRWDGSTGFFFHERIVDMANVLGQFKNSSIYDSVMCVYRQQGWHRVWLSVLRLLHTAVATCGTESLLRTDCLSAVANLATSSPRFRDAVSGFYSLNAEKLIPFSWEVYEIHICTSLVTLLTSLGAPTPALTPLVRQCFCRIRHHRLKSTLPAEETPRITMMDERPFESLFVFTVRHQLIYLIQQPLPPLSAGMHGADIVTLERFRRGPDPENQSHTAKLEEQLSFGVLRAFILEKLSIIRKSHRENATGATAIVSPEHTPMHHSFAGTVSSILADADSVIGSEICDWHDYGGVGPHMESVQLACGLFVQYARLYAWDQSLDLWGRQELIRNVEKLVHTLQRLIHDARNVENCALAWVIGTAQELQSVVRVLQLGRSETSDTVFH